MQDDGTGVFPGVPGAASYRQQSYLTFWPTRGQRRMGRVRDVTVD
jgi:hypothetical protein